MILPVKAVAAGTQMASDLMDAQISKAMGTLGGHTVKEISTYDNADLIQKYLDQDIISVEAIFIAMQRACVQSLTADIALATSVEALFDSFNFADDTADVNGGDLVEYLDLVYESMHEAAQAILRKEKP